MLNIEIYSANGGIVVRLVKFDSFFNLKKDLGTWDCVIEEIMKIAFSERTFNVISESNGDDWLCDSTFLFYNGFVSENQSYHEFEIEEQKYISIDLDPFLNFFDNCEYNLGDYFQTSEFWFVSKKEDSEIITKKIIKNENRIFDEDEWLDANSEFMFCTGSEICYSFFYGPYAHQCISLIWSGATISAEELKQKLINKSNEKRWKLNISLSDQKLSAKPKERIFPKCIFEDQLKALNKNHFPGYRFSIRIFMGVLETVLLFLKVISLCFLLMMMVYFCVLFLRFII